MDGQCSAQASTVVIRCAQAGAAGLDPTQPPTRKPIECAASGVKPYCTEAHARRVERRASKTTGW